jgi:transposase-like protein
MTATKLKNKAKHNKNTKSSIEYECRCKYCGSHHTNKRGIQNKKQRYICRDCKRTFSEGVDRRVKYNPLLRSLAITSYLSGLSMRGIQRMLSISFKTKIHFNSIEEWLRNANNILQEGLDKETQRRKEERISNKTGEKTIIPVVEMDELFTYVKKNPKILKEKNTMINEYGLLWIDSEMKLLHLR